MLVKGRIHFQDDLLTFYRNDCISGDQFACFAPSDCMITVDFEANDSDLLEDHWFYQGSSYWAGFDSFGRMKINVEGIVIVETIEC